MEGPLATGGWKMRDPMELRVVIAAGGTGGHLFPGIAVAREFVVRHQAAVTFLTTPKAVTTQILERLRLRLGGRLLPGLERRGPAEPGPHPAGGAGGRARGPGPAESPQPPPGPGYGGPFRRTRGRGGLAFRDSPGAPRTKRHSRGHQPLSVPAGRQNLRVLPRQPGFFSPGRSLWTGNPIRPEFFDPAPPRAASPFTVMITGGSQGAHALNMAVLAALPRLYGLERPPGLSPPHRRGRPGGGGRRVPGTRLCRLRWRPSPRRWPPGCAGRTCWSAGPGPPPWRNSPRWAGPPSWCPTPSRPTTTRSSTPGS